MMDGEKKLQPQLELIAIKGWKPSNKSKDDVCGVLENYFDILVIQIKA